MSIENVFSFIDIVEKRKVARYTLILLNALLLCMLTHYCYTWTIGAYSFANFESTEQVLNYFLTGRFLIPFLMFLLIWLTTDLMGTWMVNKFVSWVLKYTMPLKRAMLENDSFMTIGWLRNLTTLLSQDKVSRNAVWNQNPQQIEMQCAHGQKFIRDSLQILVRFVICIFIAFFCISGFPIILLLLTLVLIFFSFHFGRLFYLMFEVIPFFAHQYQEAAKRIQAQDKTKE